MKREKITLEKKTKLFDEGAYGTVFFFPDKKRAIKVYRKHREADEEHSRQTFESETTALKIANEDGVLKGLVPIYYGAVEIDKILDENGTDITEKYLATMNFEMEFIEGRFLKLGQVDRKELDRISELFRKANIHYVKDASATFEGGKATKIIDIGVTETELWAKD